MDTPINTIPGCGTGGCNDFSGTGCGGREGKGAYPVLRDEEHVYTSEAKAAKGGDMTVGLPEYKLNVTNPTGNNFIQ
jgi:hypothetical protein